MHAITTCPSAMVISNPGRSHPALRCRLATTTQRRWPSGWQKNHCST